MAPNKKPKSEAEAYPKRDVNELSAMVPLTHPAGKDSSRSTISINRPYVRIVTDCRARERIHVSNYTRFIPRSTCNYVIPIAASFRG